MNRYREIFRKHKAVICVTAAAGVLASAAMVFAGYSLSFFFSAYEQQTDRIKALILTFAVELVIWLAAMGIYYMSLLLKCRAKKLIRHELRNMAGERISALDYRQFKEKDCGNMISWLTNDVELLYEQSFAAFFAGTEALASWVFSLISLFSLGSGIGISALLLLAVISVLPQIAGKYLQKANESRSQAMETAVERYKDAVMGADVFALAGLRTKLADRLSDASRKAEQSDCRFNRINVSVQILISACSLAGQVILLFVSFLAAALGSAVPGAVLSVANLSGSFFNGVGEFTQAAAKMKASGTLWDKFTEEKPKRKNKNSIGTFSKIRCENVSFCYADHPVLEKINFRFAVGGKYAIIGESGSGKSTLVKVLLGLLPNYSGNIYYDEIEQREIELEEIAGQAAYAEQRVYLFQDTLRFNITLGQDYAEEKIRAVLAKCRLDGFVASLPKGLDTQIGENGKNLSGGQCQRIALARSLIRDVHWIILDEGTSALDENNAAEIENMLMEQEDLGVILITHHLRENIKARLTAVYKIEKTES